MNKTNKSVYITSLIVAGVIILALISVFSGLFVKKEQTTLSVDGFSIEKVIPDLITIDISVITEGETASKTKNANSEIKGELMKKLKRLGFKEKDVATISYNIRTEYGSGKRGRELKKYVAIHRLKVKIKSNESERISSVIDAGADVGALIDYINFELSQELKNKHKAEALKKATEDAKHKAESIAGGLGKKLGEIKSISSSSFDYYPWRAYDATGLSAQTAEKLIKEVVTEIHPGEKEISAHITIVYELVK